MNANRRIAAIAACVVSMGALSAQAGSEAAGTSAGLSLRRSPTARETALGQAGTVRAEGVAALFWNASNLAETRSDRIAFHHQAQTEGIAMDAAGWARGVGTRAGFGIALSNVDYGSFGQTDDAGVDVGTLSPRDTTLISGLALSFGRFRAGVAGKFLHSKIIHSDNVLTFDAAVSGRFNRTDVSVAVANVTGTLRYVNDEEALPRSTRMSAARWLTPRIWIGADGVFPRDGAWYPAVGGEALLGSGKRSGGALRVGFNGGAAREKNGLAGFSMGGGFFLGRWGLDYAWTVLGELGSLHTFSIEWRR